MQVARARAAEPKAAEPQQHMMALRELGIYTLPDGREYVVSTLYADGCCLYVEQMWWLNGSAAFWVGCDGQLLRRGEPTGWSALDMKDTGRTAKYPERKLL